MNQKKIAIITVLFFCFVAVTTAGCIAQDSDTPIVGKWKADSTSTSSSGTIYYDMFIFDNDGLGINYGLKISSGTLIGPSFRWDYDGYNTITIDYHSDSGWSDDTYIISDDGKTLAGNSKTYHKI